MKRSIVSTATFRRRNRAGLTLLELIVVLFILAAIAGIAIAAFPGFQKLTHGSTSANAIRSGQSAVGVRVATGRGIGGGLDGLVDAGGLVPYFIDQGTGSLTPVAMDDDIVSALNGLGIDEVFTAFAATGPNFAGFTGAEENATFGGHDYTAPIAVAPSATDPLAAITDVTDTTFNFNLDVGQFDNIFVFGLGEQADLVGANGTFQEAPVHTPGEGTAIEQYGRYVILVGYEAPAVPGDGGEATYLGITCIDDGENFNNINRNLGEYLEAQE